MTARTRSVALVLLALAAVAPGAPGGRAHAGQRRDLCDAPRSGAHDAKVDIRFTASVSKNGRARMDHGSTFEFGTVRDLMIEVRWQHLKVPARQRLELYSPDSQLYQMVTHSLPARPDPVVVTIPVSGTQIEGATMAGTWCVKIFRDGDREPVAAEGFDLKFRNQ